MALVKVGSPTITSLTEESNERRLCTTLYDLARDEILSQYPWNCCLVRSTLSPDATAPDSEWDYRYALPADCLKVHKVYSEYIDYRVENGYILTNEGTELSIVYQQQITDTSKIKPHVVSCIVTALAAKLAFPLVQNAVLGKNLLDELYGRVLPGARGTDIFESPPKNKNTDTWLDSRENYEGFNTWNIWWK